MRHYSVTLSVPEDKLNVIVGTVQNSFVTIVDIRLIEKLAATTSEPRRKNLGNNFNPNGNPNIIDGAWALKHKDRLFEVMKPGVKYHITSPELIEHMKGLSTDPAFVGTIFAALARARVVERVARGWYVRA